MQVTSAMSKWRRIIYSQLMLVTLMAPTGIYFFGGVSWSSVLFNLIFIPWFSVVIVPTLFCAVFFLFIGFPYVSAFWQVVNWTFLPVTQALEYSISGWVGVGDSAQILILLLSLIWFFRALLSWYALSLFTLISLGWFGFKTPAYSWRMDILDVGHGLSVLFEKDGQFLLYDTGSSWPQGSYVSSVITPIISKRGASSLHTVIYSHLDDDHAGGRKDVEYHLSPQYVYASQPIGNSLACIRGQRWDWQGLKCMDVCMGMDGITAEMLPPLPAPSKELLAVIG